MLPSALLGLILIGALLGPALVYVFLRRRAGLDLLPVRCWLTLSGVSFVFQPVFLLRKHLEAALVKNNPAWPALLLAQVDNGWWEELANLLALVVILKLAPGRIRPLLQKLPAALGLGYWAGLAYGVGEALVLAFLFIVPGWAPIFGLNTFTPFALGWPFTWERLWAIQLHAVMGALIGAGLWSWLNGRRGGLVIGFIVAMLYHHLVDGSIILAGFVPALATLIRTLGSWFVPLLAVIGYGLIGFTYVFLKRKYPAPTVSAPEG